ncbi:hypothetical protein ABK040_007358 [Willaertia magna]
MSFAEITGGIRNDLNGRSNKLVDETIKLCNLLIEGSKQDDYITKSIKHMTIKYEPMITTTSDIIENNIQSTTNDLKQQMSLIEKRLNISNETSKSVNEIVDKLKKMGLNEPPQMLNK